MTNSTLKTKLALATTFGLALAATATAGTFSVSGAGGPIPDAPVTAVPWNTTTTGFSTFNSTVSVSRSVTSISSVVLTGFAHTWRGDLHAYLTNPGGSRFNIIVRPGFTGLGFGDSGDFPAGSVITIASAGAPLNVGAGLTGTNTYAQFLNSGAGSWTSGTFVIANTPIGSITGGSGTWTLTIADWGNADVGSLTGWTLNGTDSSAAAFCFGDGTGTACPCANSGALGKGCANSAGGSAQLTSAGTSSAAANDLVLTSSGMMPGSFCIYVQGTAQLGGGLGVLSAAYDGLDCIGGTILRLGRIGTLGGTSSISNIVVQGAIPPAGGTRHYQGVYRNQVAFCTAATLNSTNGLTIVWTP